MAISRDTLLHSNYYYAKLLVTPTSSSSSSTTPTPIDSISLLQLITKSLGDWFGPAGSINPLQLDIVHLAPATSSSSEAEGAREAILRLPSSSAHQALTSLPLNASSVGGQEYAVRVLASGETLAALGGKAGGGRGGWEGWLDELSAESG